jgi:repressor LexA
MIHFGYMEKERQTEKELQALRFLRNAIVHQGRSPSVRDLARALEYKSPRTAFLVLQSLIEQGWVKRKAGGTLQLRKDLAESEDHARTVEVPLVGSVACGVPILAEENVEAHIQVSISLARAGHKYFLLRAAGDSMDDAGINDGNLVLVRQQASAQNGDVVVALIDDAATIKEFHREKDVVLLKPRSTNKQHRPIVLKENFLIQGVVTSVLRANLY